MDKIFVYKKIVQSVCVMASFFVFSIPSVIYAETVTDGSVTLDVLEYNSVDGWLAGTVYDGKVTVDFADITSVGKQISITLPEGMRFVNYPVNGTPTAGTPGYEIDSGSVLAQFIDSVVDPPRQTYYPSYNGALVYNLTTTCESIEISFKMAVDEITYYGPKVIADAVTATASKNAVNLGNTSMDVNGIGNSYFSTWSGTWQTVTALTGSIDPVNLPAMSFYRAGHLASTAFYAKKITGYYYYPPETEFISAAYPDNIIENNALTGYISYEWNNRYASSARPSAVVSVENTAPGLYPAASRPTFQMTTYDDTVIDVARYTPINVNVLAGIDNKLQITSLGWQYYKHSDDYYSQGLHIRIFNDAATVKTNQYVEYTIDPNYEVIKVVIPRDSILGMLGDVQYKTNLNASLRTATSGQIIAFSSTGVYISAESLGLSANEYITYVNASIGDVSKSYQSVNTSLRYINNASRIIGKLKDGINTANVTVRTYSLLPDDNVEPNSEVSTTKAITRVTSPSTALRPFNYPISMNAGETINVNHILHGSHYYYTNSVGMVNPKAYIRIPENTEIDLASITVTGNVDGSLPFTVTGPYTSAVSGEDFVEIAITGKVGSYFDTVEYYSITLNYDFIAGLGAGGNYNWIDYVFWKNDVSTNYSNPGGYGTVVADTLDVDNDGNVTEKLKTGQDDDILIISKEEMIIDTYITPEGETRKPPYDGTAATAIGFTPGTTAKYTLDFLNNRTDSVNSVDAYVPIPKDGNNFGTNFQENEFYWNMKLDGTPTVTILDQFGTDITATAAANYAVTYSTDATTETNYQGAVYTGTPSASTTMIRVENTVGVPPGEQAILEFDYVVDETIASVTADPTKLGATNDFKPYYYFNSGTSGWQSGTKVGATLEIGQIAGQVFLDQDIDGIYNGSDSLLESKTISLYKHNGTSYILNQSTTTDGSGNYSFDELSNGIYRVDFNGALQAGSQEFTKQNQGSDESLDSDPPFTGAIKGYVDNINPTEDIARETDAGIINYSPTTQLSASLNKSSTSIKKTNAQTTFTEQLEEAISPTFFDSIKATSQPIVWTSSDPTVVSVSNGLIQGTQTGSETITLTITDMYGNTDNAQTTVTVTSNDIPSITSSNTTIDLGEQIELLQGITASDTEDGNITDRVVVTANDLNIQIPNTYTITYEVTDNDGNTATTDRTITVEAIAPTAVTGSVSDVIQTEATLNASVLATGGEEVTREIQWGTTSGVYANTCTTTPGIEGHYSCAITSLTESTTYYYRAKVTNSAGTIHGQEKSFATQIAQTQQTTINTQGIITITGDAILGGS